MKKSNTPWLIGGGLVVLALALFIVPKYLPSQYDEFAQCLTDKGVKYYGAWWCPNCQNQNNAFGSAKKYLNYTECYAPGQKQQQLPVCSDAKIESYPTWEFADGERLIGFQDFKTLAEKTSCELP
ncbi:MAG: hypothetical protein KGZ30_03535 [Anaplasmataceae bacterium]|nr:hypothetical protein [Anaplasmataceae bacterium]